MSPRQLTWNAEQLPNGVVRMAFAGRGGIGSEGNPDGALMLAAIREAVAAHAPAVLLIDLTDFDYRFGDWIGGVAVSALSLLGKGRVCMLATGKTGASLQSLWTPAQLAPLVPVFEKLSDALVYLSDPNGQAGA